MRARKAGREGRHAGNGEVKLLRDHGGLDSGGTRHKAASYLLFPESGLFVCLFLFVFAEN